MRDSTGGPSYRASEPRFRVLVSSAFRD
jgi:hypothetical protein